MPYLFRITLLSIASMGIATIICIQSFAQYRFSIGINTGFGFTPFSQQAKLCDKTICQSLTSNAGFTTGILGQYMIGERIGMETGLQHIYSTYRFTHGANQSLNYFLGKNAVIAIHDYQIPVVMFLRTPHGSNPYTYFKLSAGTCFDWLTTQYLTKLGPILSLHTLLAGIRMEIDKGKAVRVEYGLAYQYSFDRYSVKVSDYRLTNNVLDSRLHMLSFHICLFFIHKRLD